MVASSDHKQKVHLFRGALERVLFLSANNRMRTISPAFSERYMSIVPLSDEPSPVTQLAHDTHPLGKAGTSGKKMGDTGLEPVTSAM